MSEISRSSMYRNKIKKEAKKDATKKNKVCVIFQSPEEEKRFSEITHRLNYEKTENGESNER